MDTEETSLTDDLGAAFDESVGNEEESNDENTSELDPGTDGGAAEVSGEAEESSTEDESTEDSGAVTEPAAEEGESTEASADDNTPEPPKAPIDYSPELREKWGDMPKEVQEHILKREAAMQQAMAGTAEARRTHDTMSQLFTSFAPVLAAEGAESPMAAVQSMFQTVAEMRMGTPAQKANVLAGMVQHYGIDIHMLDQALIGQTPADTQTTQFEQMLDKRMAPINQVMEQLTNLQNNGAQASQDKARSAVASFSKDKEFIGDVGNDMADLIDLASKNGRDMSLEQAYNLACSSRPDIAAIMKTRSDAEALKATGDSNAAKKAASSSVMGRSASTGGDITDNSKLSLEGDLNAAWDAAAG